MSKEKPPKKPAAVKKKAKNLTFEEKVLSLADEIMEAKGQHNLSALIEELIRGDYERRFGVLGGSSSTSKPSALTPEERKVLEAAEKAARAAVEHPVGKKSQAGETSGGA